METKVGFVALVGVVVGATTIATGFVMEGGQLQSLLHPSSFLIICGGTLGALLVQFPGNLLLESFKAGLNALVREPEDPRSLVDTLVALAELSRKKGLFNIDDQVKKWRDPWARRILELVVDTQESARVEQELQRERERLNWRQFSAADVFDAAGGYAPTLGVLGAVLGLVQVMQNINQPESLGQGIAIAFVSTIYGVALANLLFFPLAGKLRLAEQEEKLAKEILLSGAEGVSRGDHPRQIRKLLSGIVDGHSAARR